MTKRILVFFVLVSSLVFAAQENLEQDIDNRVESINARKGIEIGGTIRSASFNSNFESAQEKSIERGSPDDDNYGYYINQMPSHEIAEFVQVDLDFKFRPWDNIRANLKLRLGAGMQEFFAAAATTVNAPWLNIEGNAGESFYWVVGDFRQSYSPLTLYMPGPDIIYEPMVFARKREMAQKDALLDGNQRNLQGFNLQFRPQLGEALGELRIEALGARLRRAGYLDASGAMGNMLPNEGIAGATQAGRFDKFLLGGNLELLPLNKNLLIGGTYLSIFDDKKSSLYYTCENNCRQNDFNKNYLLNTLDSLPQKTAVFAGRAGADIAGIIGNNSLIINLTGEFAHSDDKVYTIESFIDEDSEDNDVIITNKSKQETGNAILAQLELGYKSSVNINAVLSSSFIRNDSAWFNNVAQSPSFFARRMLNSDKDIGCLDEACFRNSLENENRTFNLSKYGVYSPLYSSFDALYFFTPKHSPMNASLNNYTQGDGQTSSYNIAPYTKNSWNASTLTRAELALLEELSDLNLQMALPNGFATSNRQGFQEVLTLSWANLAEAKGLFANYEQLSRNAGAKTVAKYAEFGGGAKIDVLGIFGFEKNPLELSGSYKKSAKEQEWENWGKATYASDFINAGLYYRFFRKFGLTVGYQQINSKLNAEGADLQKEQTGNLRVSIVPIVNAKQNQWMAGLDYTVAKNAWLSINYGIMSVENIYKLKSDKYSFVDDDGNINRLDQNTDLPTNLPNYAILNRVEPGQVELKHEFSRNILEATINVEF